MEGEGTDWIAFEDSELDRFVQQEEEAFSALQWSKQTLPLSKFIKKFPLPQIVRVEEGYYSPEEESSLSSGQVLKVHCIKSCKKVLGKDQHGTDVHIPLNTSEKVLLRPENWNKSYESVSDLSQARPMPKYVKVTRGYYDPSGGEDHDHTIDPGERLTVLGEVDPSSFPKLAKNRFMKFRNQNKVELKLPFDSSPQFTPLLDINHQLFAEAVLSSQLPVHVSFVAPRADNNNYEKDQAHWNLSRFGVIKLIEIYEEQLLIASCGHRGVRVVFTIPNTIDVTVKVAHGTLSMDPTYDGLCREYNNYNEIETLAIKRHEKDVYKTAGEVRGYEYHLQSIGGGRFEGMEEADCMNINSNDDDSGYRYDEDEAQSPGAASIKSRGTWTDEVTDSHANDFKEGGKYTWHVSQSCDDGSEETSQLIDAKAQSKKDPVKLLSIKKLIRDYMGGTETGQAADESKPDNHGKMDEDHPVSINLNNNTISPKLAPETSENIPAVTPSTENKPKSQPTLVKSAVVAPLSPKTDQVIASASSDSAPETESPAVFEVPANLETMSMDEVCKCLSKLNLGKLEEIFRENQINGEMLVSLEADDCKDLGLTNFQAKKILKFVAGWRPDE